MKAPLSTNAVNLNYATILSIYLSKKSRLGRRKLCRSTTRAPNNV